MNTAQLPHSSQLHPVKNLLCDYLWNGTETRLNLEQIPSPDPKLLSI